MKWKQWGGYFGLFCLLFMMLALFALAPAARGQCWGGNCGPVIVGPPVQFGPQLPIIINGPIGVPVQPAPAPAPAAKKAGSCDCCDNCPCDGDSCPCKLGKEPCSSGCRCLLASKPAVDPVEHPGVILEHMGKRGESYQINGREVSRQAIVDKLSTVPDDRAALSLTFMGGTEQERSAAVAAAKSVGLDKKLLINAYDSTSPLVKDKGFDLSGHPSAYLQAPSGKALAKRLDASEASLTFIADQAKSFDDSKVPTGNGFTLADLEKQLQAPFFGAPLLWWIIGGVLLFIYWKRQPPAAH